jgi:sugar lactone lactonase YvrE
VDIVGNVYVSDRGNNTVRKITSAGVVTTLVGLPGSAGNEDGMGTAARFNEPSGVAVDSAGSLYIADAGNCTIRKVTATGVVTTLAGVAGSAGSEDRTGRAARFNDPCGVAVDSRGILIVADSGNDVVRKVTSAGKVTTVAGLAGSAGNADGTGSGARFYGPSGVAIDKAGNAYVADRHNFTIRKVTPAGVVTTVAGLAVNAGSADGAGSEARFNDPMGVAVDAAGSIYVTDTGSSTIRRVAAGIVTTLAGMTRGVGSADGTGSAARFNSPAGIAVDSKGNLYVADVGSHTIRKGIPAGIQ